MALSAGTHWFLINGGDDTNFSGGFDTGQTAGMLTDGAATSATGNSPVFTSASYNFVAGDAGARIYIASGTNWIPGWYLIASVAANAATLTATIGTATLAGLGLNTAAGCATTASPTGATWAIDYSMAAASRFTYTDLTAAGAGSTFTSAGNPFGQQMVGNLLKVNSGTNVTAGTYAIASVSVVTATFDRACTTGVTSNGAGRVGGAKASIGAIGLLYVASNVAWVKYNATAFTSTATTNNAAAGRFSFAAGTTTAMGIVQGYETTPGDMPTTNYPILKWGVNAASNAVITTAANTLIRNLKFDCNRANFTNTMGIKTATGSYFVDNVKITSASAGGFFNNSGTAIGTITQMEVTDCVTVAAVTVGAGEINMDECNIHDNAIDGVSISTGKFRSRLTPIVNNINGAAASNIVATGAAVLDVEYNTIYGAGTHGIDIQVAPVSAYFKGNIIEGNGGAGLNAVSSAMLYMINNGFYNNTSGKYPAGVIPTGNIRGEVNYSSTAFTNAAGGDFSLNNTAGAGASLRAVGARSPIIGSSTNTYHDIGAAQHQDSGGGGGLAANPIGGFVA